MEPILLRADRAGERADQLLARLVPELTRSAAQRLLEEGAVTLGGRPVKEERQSRRGRRAGGAPPGAGAGGRAPPGHPPGRGV